MSYPWVTYKLGDLCEMRYGKMPKPSDKVETGFPIFSGYGVVGYAGSFHYADPKIVVIARGVGGTGDIVMSPPNSFVTNISIVLDLDHQAALQEFLYYRLHASTLRELRTGTAQPQVVIADLKNYEVALPSLPTQKKIASILSAYDDLIENNNRRIEILEEMAQNVYREWFVHFRYPGHENVPLVDSELGQIPQGWEVKQLGDVFKLQQGRYLKSPDMQDTKDAEHSIEVYGARDVIGYSNRAIYNSPTILISCRGAYSGVTQLTSGECWVSNNSIACLPLKQPHTFSWHQINNTNFSHAVTGSAQPQITITNLSPTRVVTPVLDLIEQFDRSAYPVDHAIQVIQQQNQNLRKTRDLLLPKLISGQLDVEELDIKV